MLLDKDFVLAVCAKFLESCLMFMKKSFIKFMQHVV